MPNNYDGIKTQKFGIEVEMTGVTRGKAAKVVAHFFNTESEPYDTKKLRNLVNIRQEHISQREQNVEPMSASQEESVITPDENETAAVNEFEEENEESFEMSM